MQSLRKDTLYYLVGELVRACQFGVGRQVFAFIIINHCSSTLRNGSVMTKRCSGASRWSQGRQMAWQEGGTGIRSAFWAASKLAVMHEPWLLPWPQPVPAGPRLPLPHRPLPLLRVGSPGMSQGEVSIGHSLYCPPVPVGCGLSRHAEVCGCVISNTLISPGSVTGSMSHKSGCLAWGSDLPRGSVGW